MFQKLKIKNYQYHRQSVLDFSSGLNVIYGDNAQGKTCILRALNWVVNNKPSGFNFKTRGDDIKETKVVLETENSVITRRRTKTVNDYQLDKTVFKALKLNVPDEIQSALNLSEYCYQDQHSKYFLFQDTDGEVAKKINKIAGLNQIDNILAKAKSLKEKNNQDIKQSEKELAYYKKEFIKYKPVNALNKKIKVFEKRFTKLQNKEEQRIRLSKLLEKVKRLSVQAEVLSPVTELANRLKHDIEKVTELKKTEARKKQLFFLIKNILNTEKAQKSTQFYIDKKHDIDVMIIDLKKINIKIKKISTLSTLINKIYNKQKNIDKQRHILTKANEEKINTEKELKICPLCSNPF